MASSPRITAIETRYAGCRFRSRLEARWAVFFDHLGIRWEYEPQGYVIDGKPYLPDFRLPDLDMWAEVKGQATEAEVVTMARAAVLLPYDHPATFSALRSRFLILGSFPPDEVRAALHWCFYQLGPYFWISAIRFNAYWPLEEGFLFGPQSIDDPRLVGSPEEGPDPVRRVVAGGHAHFYQSPPDRSWTIKDVPHVREAYQAARSARFEHGERG